jgi:hypothetical protein
LALFKHAGLLLAVFCLSTTARAAPVTFEFTGSVTQVPVDEVFGDVVVGSAIIGFYTFDSQALDGAPADSSTGSYTMFGLPYVFSVNVGGHNFSTSDFLNVSVFNFFVDQYTVFAQETGGDLSLEIFLQDNTATALGNDLLPLVPPPLGSFAQRDFHLTATIGDGQVQFDGIIGSLNPVLEPNPVPEPFTFPLILAGFALCGLVRLKQRKLNCGC